MEEIIRDDTTPGLRETWAGGLEGLGLIYWRPSRGALGVLLVRSEKLRAWNFTWEPISARLVCVDGMYGFRLSKEDVRQAARGSRLDVVAVA